MVVQPEGSCNQPLGGHLTPWGSRDSFQPELGEEPVTPMWGSGSFLDSRLASARLHLGSTEPVDSARGPSVPWSEPLARKRARTLSIRSRIPWISFPGEVDQKSYHVRRASMMFNYGIRPHPSAELRGFDAWPLFADLHGRLRRPIPGAAAGCSLQVTVQRSAVPNDVDSREERRKQACHGGMGLGPALSEGS